MATVPVDTGSAIVTLQPIARGANMLDFGYAIQTLTGREDVVAKALALNGRARREGGYRGKAPFEIAPSWGNVVRHFPEGGSVSP